jgi:YVTN family beta-propeller protein
LAVSPDGLKVYAAQAGVSVISTATNTVTTTIPVGGSGALVNFGLFGVAVGPDGSRVYVAAEFTNPSGTEVLDAVLVIDATTDKVIATVPVASIPFGMAVSPDGSTVYVANHGSLSGLLCGFDIRHQYGDKYGDYHDPARLQCQPDRRGGKPGRE